jgi:hydroxypyruvate isomerase
MPLASTMLWTLEGSFEERLEMAARAGFESVELVGEYAQWSATRLREVKRLCRSLGLGIDMLLATPAWDSRPVSMVDPAHRENFLNDVRTALGRAQELEATHVFLLSGNTVPGRSREVQCESLVEAARRAGDLAAQSGLMLALEPINCLVDRKGFFLNTCVEGVEIVRRIDNPHVRLLFDVYHEQVQAGNIIRTLKAAAPYIAGIHIADNPGRHEPGSGEVHFDNVYRAIKEIGFEGAVAMEYYPRGNQLETLARSCRQLRACWAGAPLAAAI